MATSAGWCPQPCCAGSGRPCRARARIQISAAARLGGTEATPIDIVFLLEQLEREIASGRSMPLTSNVIVDRERVFDLLDQLRTAIPEEIRQARRINEETERIVDRAQEEAERILARAQEQAAFLIEERELTRAAQERSREIVAHGEREAEEIRRGADEYAQSVLVHLEGECVKALQSIKRGLALLDERHAAAAIAIEGDGMAEPLPTAEAEPEPTRAQL